MFIDHELIISWLATVCGLGLYCTGIHICWKIVEKNSANEVPFFPFLALFCNASLWLKYGFIKNDTVLIGVNGTGAFFTFSYIVLYFFYAASKVQVLKKMFLALLMLFPLLSYIQYYTPNKDSAIYDLSIICASSSVVGYGAPLSSLKEVLRTKSTACLSFPLCLANFIVSGEWIIYGIIKKDLFVKVPNVLGFLLGSIQLLLFIIYPSQSKHPSPISIT